MISTQRRDFAGLLADRQQASRGSQVPAAVHERGRGQHALVQGVDVQEFELRTRGEDVGFSEIVGEVDFAVDADRRGREAVRDGFSEPRLEPKSSSDHSMA